MASGGLIEAGRAAVRIFADDSALVRGLKKSEKSLKQWGKSVAGIGAGIFAGGAAIAGPLAAAVKVAADLGGQLADASDKTGVSVESLSQLQHAAEISGSSLEGVTGALRKQAQFTQKAKEGNKEAADTLAAMGMSAKDLAGKNPDQVFRLMADGISSIKDPTLKAQLAMDVFGKSGVDLIPMLKDGSAGLQKMTQEAEALGLTVSDEAARGLDDLGDSAGTVLSQLKRMAVGVAGALVPSLQQAVNWVQMISADIIRFIDANRGLVIGIAAVAGGLMLAGGLLIGLGGILSLAGAALGAIATVCSTVAGIVGGALSGAFGLLTSPVLLLGVGLASLATYFLGFQNVANGIGGILDDLASGFSVVRETAGAVLEALQNGQWAAAGDLLYTALQMGLTKIQIAFQQVWGTVKNTTLDAITDMRTWFSSWFADTLASFGDFGNKIYKTMSDVFAAIQNLFARGSGSIANLIIRMVGKVQGLSDKQIQDQIDTSNQMTQEKINSNNSANVTRQQWADDMRDPSKRAQYKASLQAQATQDKIDRASQQDAELQSLQGRMADLRSQWQDAKDQAAQAKEQVAKQVKPDAKDIVDQTKGGPSASTAGTFLGAVAGMLGGSAQDRIASATEKTAKNTEKLLDQQQTYG